MLKTHSGTMPLEMPAITMGCRILVAGGRFRTLLSLHRSTFAMVVAFGTYPAILVL